VTWIGVMDERGRPLLSAGERSDWTEGHDGYRSAERGMGDAFWKGSWTRAMYAAAQGRASWARKNTVEVDDAAVFEGHLYTASRQQAVGVWGGAA
jgi:hypothetical protein